MIVDETYHTAPGGVSFLEGEVTFEQSNPDSAIYATGEGEIAILTESQAVAILAADEPEPVDENLPSYPERLRQLLAFRLEQPSGQRYGNKFYL